MYSYLLPHPMKLKAAAQPIVVVPIVLFTDDTSGNKCKKWNKFEWWGFVLAGLPQSESRKPSNIHFISCSNIVPLLDMSVPIAEQLQLAEEGFEAHDPVLDTTVFVSVPVLLVSADNVRHSELLHHMGSKANKFCRICMVWKCIGKWFYLYSPFVVTCI